MPREVPEIDRLIEEGLTLYGQGDLDGALARWERVLALDPDNPQANSYVDYIRANYDLLMNETNAQTVSDVPFGIADDEPEYQIEIQPGEIKPSSPAPPPMSLEPTDEGWTIDEETHDQSITLARPSRTARPDETEPPERPSQDVTLEIEADEPPPPFRFTPRAPASASTLPGLGLPKTEPEGVSFDDATREYNKHDQRRAASDPYGGFEVEQRSNPAAEFGPSETPSFGQPADFQTPPGFGTQATGIKQRSDLGFVKPAPEAKSPGATFLGLPERPRAPARASEPPTSRGVEVPPEQDLSLEPADLATKQHAPIEAQPDDQPPRAGSELDDLDLIASLPSPRPAPSVPRVEIETPLSGSQQKSTKDFPTQTRMPALPAAATREMKPDEVPAVSTSQTQDFDAKTTERPGGKPGLDQTSEIPNMAQVALISAPTRDLGLREIAAARGDEPAAAARVGDGTRADVVLPFDPIDARATEIIEDVDETAPRNEAKEDQTRRRITTLFDKASQWSAEGDLERAVAAVDLALSEDPNSALAQKLIHRNRDTIMTVFQAYLGDLERTPQLARPLHELSNAPISPRAAFLLSRIDGMLSIDEILDVCGMPRLEAFRYLCQLFLRGILR